MRASRFECPKTSRFARVLSGMNPLPQQTWIDEITPRAQNAAPKMLFIHVQPGMSPLPLQLGLVRQPPRAKCRRTCCSFMPNQKPQILTLTPPQVNSSTRAHTKDARMPSCLPWICPRWALRTGVVCRCLSVLRSSTKAAFLGR